MSYNDRLFSVLKKIHERYLQLNNDLSNVDLSVNEIIEINKKISEIEELDKAFVLYQKLVNDCQQSEYIIDNELDKDLISLAQNELDIAKKSLIEHEIHVQSLLLPKDENDNKDVIVEMRSAAGGDESSIFVNDLFDCYKHYANANNWKIQILDVSLNAVGTTYLSFSLQGKDVYAKMKFESGVHRVQRVPLTESKGRVHTSTITVNVMPEQDEIDVQINPSDLRVDVYKASGAGGQHVNKTESAVRITHIPTGIVVACQEGKSQFSNRDKAMKMLRAKLWQKAVDEQSKEINVQTKLNIGSGERSEKIRTYNYPQNRITDHRISLSLSRLDTIMLGDLSDIHNALISDQQSKALGSIGCGN